MSVLSKYEFCRYIWNFLWFFFIKFTDFFLFPFYVGYGCVRIAHGANIQRTTIRHNTQNHIPTNWIKLYRPTRILTTEVGLPKSRFQASVIINLICQNHPMTACHRPIQSFQLQNIQQDQLRHQHHRSQTDRNHMSRLMFSIRNHHTPL